MRRTRVFVTFAAGLVLIALGSVVWMSRFDYPIEIRLQNQLKNELIAINPDLVTDLSDECHEAMTTDGWIMFILDTELSTDSVFRTYFETAEERVGLWVEYDQGLLRLGLGLGFDNPSSNTDIPLRWVRRNSRETFIIGVTREQTRVIANAIDKKKNWPGDLARIWRCNAVQIGSESRELSEGHECVGCNISLRYATGSNKTELMALLNSLSNVQSFNMRRVLGSVLSIVGVLLSLFAAAIPGHLGVVWRTPRLGVPPVPQFGRVISFVVNVFVMLAVILASIGFFALRDFQKKLRPPAELISTTVDLPIETSVDVQTVETTSTPAETTITPSFPKTFIVQIANASRISGSAGLLTSELQAKGYVVQPALNKDRTTPRLTETIIYFLPGNEVAAAQVSQELGGVTTLPMPTLIPTETRSLGEASVLVLLGTDLAGKSLAGLSSNP